MPVQSPYKDREYQTNRAVVLEGGPPCAIGLPGCLGVATTADHIVPVAAGGDHSLANLRPACAPCNDRAGGRFGGHRSHSTSRGDGPAGLGGRVEIAHRVPDRGRATPRLVTPAAGDDSHGPRVTKWARRHMPHHAMRWNSTAYNRLLATDHGRLVHRQALVSVARQNSKTTAMEALVGWWATEYADGAGPQQIGWVSHDLKLTEAVFVFLDRLLDSRITARTFSFGRQRLELDNGSQIVSQSNTINAGHGWSFDLVICDETWRLKPEALNEGLIPSMRARPQPLLVMSSTAGDENSTVLRQWRERGLNVIEAGQPTAFAMLEWSMPPGADWHDPRWWAWPNPCLGVTLTPDTLLAEYEGPDRGAFLRGSLNMWTSSAAGWLAPGVWDACAAGAMPDPVGGAVAAEVALGGDRFYAVRAWTVNGITYTVPLIVTEYEDRLWGALEAVYGAVDTVAITPTLESHLPPGMARRTVTVGLRELARNVPLLRSMIAAGQVAHGRSPLLDEHVGRAVATRQAGLSTGHSSGSIELARCLVWAVALASRPSTSRRAAIGVAATG
jgi:hypothetical protein